MSQYLIDTGLLILHLRTHQPTVRFVRSLAASDQLFISAVTRIELRARMLPTERFNTTKLLARFRTIPIDSSIADRTGDILNALRLRGISIGVPDVMIAATALVHDLSIITLNHKDFEIIPGLRIYPWPNDK